MNQYWRFEKFNSSWNERKLIDISDKLFDGDWIEREHIHSIGEYRIVQTGNIGIGKYYDKSQNAKYINQDDFEALNATEVFPNDILISRLADPAGRSIIVPNINKKMVTAVDVAIIRNSDKFNSFFLINSINSIKILNKINISATGTTRKRISRKNLEKIKIGIPSIEEQNKIGELLKISAIQIEKYSEKISELNKLKTYLMQNMFI
ncbi:restriction endonuclease subunit S [Fructilactobacillus sp. Tb1]|uniref:restriction endonuclease subunit S n=1 Tax=Fructilactobacillus sp. Tb1 TaxID=3422304 RepID=UPI003D292731